MTITPINILANDVLSNDVKIKRLAERFKHYTSIRRDLRKAYQICEYVINLENSFKVNSQLPTEVLNNLFLINSASMHAVTLYTRWFKSTNGKPTLKVKDYFNVKSNEAIAHQAFIDLRDQYIAHNENDLLGGDTVWACYAENGNFEKIESDWIEQQFINFGTVNMAQFKTCVEIVHNTIDAVTLRNIESDLNALLQNSTLQSVLNGK